MNLTDDYYIQNLNNTILYIHKYILPLFYIFGNIGNLLSALVFSKKGWRKNVCVFYFKVCLLFSSCYINFIILTSFLTIGYNIDLQNTNIFVCKIYIYIAFLIATLTPTVLILASVDRLLISSQNIDTRLYSSKRLAYFSISISLFFFIIFNIHILIKVNIQETFPSIFVCYFDPSEIYRDFVFYFLFSFHVLVWSIVLILSIFTSKNVRHIRTIPREQRNQIRTMAKKDFQLLRCLFVHDIIFIIVSLLINIYFVYETATKKATQTLLEETIDSFLNNLLTFIYNISYCLSFIIYISISKAFRHALKRLIYKIFGQNLISAREEDNRQQNIDRDNVELNVVVVVSNIVTPI